MDTFCVTTVGFVLAKHGKGIGISLVNGNKYPTCTRNDGVRPL